MELTHFPVINGSGNPGLLFSDDLAVALFTGYGYKIKLN
jgi:hypothetical protein